jgi:hypothetical protein
MFDFLILGWAKSGELASAAGLALGLASLVLHSTD